MPRDPTALQRLCVAIDGFSLHAAVWGEAHDRVLALFKRREIDAECVSNVESAAEVITKVVRIELAAYF